MARGSGVPRGLQVGGVVALAVVVFVACAYALFIWNPTPSATADDTPADVAPTAVETTAAIAPLDAPAGTHAVIFGDSWTAGYAATPSTLGYAYLTGDTLGWAYSVDGVSGTGYLNTGPNDEGTYAARLTGKAPDDTVEVVVLQGGLNDAGLNLADFGTAVRATVDAARQAYPAATLVILGPAPATLPASSGLVVVDATLAAASAELGLHYISPMVGEWITDDNYSAVIDPDAANHPSTEGHAYLAGMTAEALRALSS